MPAEKITPKDQVEQFLSNTDEARRLSQRARDYFDHKQWTEVEANKLRARSQAPIVVNRIKPKVEGLVGLVELRKTDPKAYPRTQKHEKSAHVVTDGIRFVADNTDFELTRLDVAEEFFVEGYGGVFIGVRNTPRGIEIVINQIPWDRIYFDSHSRKKDFKDARFMGMWLWMDEDQARDTFKLSQAKVEELRNFGSDMEETNEDRPRWRSNKRNRRVRVAMHFRIVKGKWKMSVFSGDNIITKEQDSPFKDEDGLPMNPIELVCANIDRDNNRYGEVAGFLSQQDEINHRRSKYLHFNSQRQTFGNDNAIQDVAVAKIELAKPNGHVKINGNSKFGEDFGILPTQDLSAAQFNLYLDSKAEMDAVSFNAQLAGERQSGDLSGKAIGKLQQAGAIELNRQFALLSGWEKRVYDQIWFRIKQFWDEEKWIRVTDDQDNLRWVGFNSEVTAQTLLTENAQDESQPLTARQQSAQILDLLIQTENPRLNEIVETRNQPSELDVDIIIDKSFDIINIREEQFELLLRFAQTGDIDIIDIIELSEWRNKKELIEKIQRRQAERAQAAQAANQGNVEIEQAEKVTDIDKTRAETRNIDADTVQKHVGAVQKQLENMNLQTNPDSEVQVSL